MPELPDWLKIYSKDSTMACDGHVEDVRRVQLEHPDVWETPAETEARNNVTAEQFTMYLRTGLMPLSAKKDVW